MIDHDRRQFGALIVDDEPLAREKIREALRNEEDFKILAECADGGEAVDGIRRYRPDLVFLDVQMPVYDGFEVIQHIDHNEMPLVIFVTAFDQYALRAFEAHSIDYILKPFDMKRIVHSLAWAKKQLLGNKRLEVEENILSLVDPDRIHQRRHIRRLVVRSASHFRFISADEIDYIEASGNYILVHTAKERHVLRKTMRWVEEQFDPKKYIRIHRSYVVNLDKITEIHPVFNGCYMFKLVSGKELSSSRSYHDRVVKILHL